MGGGSVNQPQRDYHLELVTGNAAFAEKLLKIMRRFRLPAKITDRKGDYLVYIKEGNGVAHFLQYVGAAQAYLTFEEVRVVKEMRNNVNRVVNCETANLQKTVDAAVRQRRAITRIQESGLYLDERIGSSVRTDEVRTHSPFQKNCGYSKTDRRSTT